MLECDKCDSESCQIRRFNHRGGGVLEVVACFDCSRQGLSCSTSSRRPDGAYVAFTDWGAEHAVLVDREGKPYHRVSCVLGRPDPPKPKPKSKPKKDGSDAEMTSEDGVRTPNTATSTEPGPKSYISPEAAAYRAAARAALDAELAAAAARQETAMAQLRRSVRDFAEHVREGRRIEGERLAREGGAGDGGESSGSGGEVS